MSAQKSSQQTHPKRTAMVLVVDRLGAGFVGPFGNTWIDTPCFNQLATESLVLDQCWIDTPNVVSLSESLWSGTSCATEKPGSSPLLDGVSRSCLITDDERIAEHPLHAGFDQVELVVTHPDVKSDWEQTNLARLFSWVERALLSDEYDLIWVHSQGMQGPWDAPLEFRDQFVEEGDPIPPRSADTPHQLLESNYDRDELQAWIWAYAGQVALLDLCLSPVLQSIQSLANPPLFLFMGARGYPLGEHAVVGEAGVELLSELLHVPLIVRDPHRGRHAFRSQQLVQPSAVFHTLREWLSGVESERGLWPIIESPHAQWSQLAISQTDDQWTLRTPAWLARFRPLDDSVECQLFLKPDDYWDFNDVSDRCPEVLSEFLEFFQRVKALPPGADPRSLEPLPERLLHPVE